MIRRTMTIAGNPAWALIAQADHAHLAYEFATAWGPEPFAPLADRQQVLRAVRHHDDGWPAWDVAPSVDASSGRPLQFTEMPLAESLAIWQRSIDVTAAIGPLAAWMVAGHFSALLRHTNSWQITSSLPTSQAHEFLARQDADRLGWFADWQGVDPTGNTPAAAQRALELLQFFDALSLWYCCSAAEQPKPLTIPGGQPLRLAPEGADPDGTLRIGWQPWPFAASEMASSVTARAVPPGRYPGAAELAAVPSALVTIHWRSAPATTA
ncbi:MAG: DUF3891 family protein [Planctomycetes bacterium]|nr:DUF3891 family protein [Planctomycetota bacterium]